MILLKYPTLFFPKGTSPDCLSEESTSAKSVILEGVFTDLSQSGNEDSSKNGKKAKRVGGKVREIMLSAAEREMLTWALAGFPPSGAAGLLPRAGK